MIEFRKQEAQYEKTEAPKITGSPGESREYVAEVVKIEPFQSKQHPDWAPSIKFIFRVLEEPFVGGFASGLVTSIWTPGNKLDKWLTAFGVSGANIGDSLSSDQLKKAIVRATVVISKDGFANVTDLGVMADRDKARISPDAHKKSSFAKPAAQPSAAPQVSQPAAQVTTPGSTQVKITSSPASAVPQGEITKDDTIPF
jgi:hypothetical protein